MVSTATRTGVTDMTFVPKSFDELFRHYYPFVTQLVIRRGIARQNADDVSQAILLKFWENDVLTDFNPEMIVRSGRRTVFGSFLGAFILAYLPRHWERQNKLLRFEFDLIDDDTSYTDQDSTESWLDAMGHTVEDDTTDIEEEELAMMIRAHLILSTPINGQDKCNLTDLFDSIRARTLVGDKMSVMSLVHEFGVSEPTMQKWLKRLRAEVDPLLFH